MGISYYLFVVICSIIYIICSILGIASLIRSNIIENLVFVTSFGSTLVLGVFLLTYSTYEYFGRKNYDL